MFPHYFTLTKSNINLILIKNTLKCKIEHNFAMRVFKMAQRVYVFRLKELLKEITKVIN